MEIKAQQAIKRPPISRRRSIPPKYPFATMEVGQMFFIPNKERNTIGSYVSTRGKELGRKFSTQMMELEKQADGTWALPSKPGSKKAVRGVAVFRDA